ncbi:NAD(P)/FAD-dependent oxidoreductase [Donghicola eburneus]|uniref:Oxidoreductase n=1 Tax=Donghicola eburneus TaxID=393278 RepID=A0A1M4N0H2_9RHOB|nr:FAD-binding oxidoreductase [Donghicola eburneus]SCM66556.1 oxidoreductase [Donghicola eburneus]
MASKHTACRLPRHTGAAAWDAILGDRRPHAPLRGRETFDFAIIGGGFAGLSAARRLTQLVPQAKIAVLDAGRIGQGAAGRNSGFMIDLPHELTSDNYAGADKSLDEHTIRMNREAIAFADAAVEELQIPAAFFRRDGKVNGAASDAAHNQNITYAAHLAALNEPHEALDGDTMRELTGSEHYLSGLYTPGTVMLQPAGYVRGLADGLANQVRIFEDSPVLSVERRGDAWELRSPEGELHAGKVIMATNGHLESFGFMRGRLMHIFLFASMTDELEPEALQKLGGAPCWGITPSDPMGTTVRRISTGQGGNRIITRTVATMQPGMTTSDKQLQRASAVMQQKFDTRFPQLAGMKMAYTWSGHLCLSANHVSVTSQLDTNLYAACVQNGLGTARGTLTGICAAERAVGHTSDITEFFGNETKPMRLPPQPFSKIGANMFIRYKEWKAQEE